MRIIDLDFYADKGSAIFLGYAGEHLSTVLNFHMPAELGNNDCIYVINFLKDGESSSNIVSHFAYKTKFNTNIVEYYIPSSIMGNNTSSGIFQLVAYGMTTTIGNEAKYSILGKSTEFHYVIDNAITTDTSDLTIELSESESLALQDLIEAISRLGNIETQFNELDGLTNALGTFIEKGNVFYTLDSTTTNVTYDAANPKKIYTNAHVDNKDAFVFTTANNYYQIALCYDGTEYKRELTAGGSTTYKPWALVNNENTGNKKNSITASNKTSTTLYPSIKAVVDYLTANYIGNGNNTVSWDNLAVAVQTLINGKENTSNKLTSEEGIDSNSTDTEYPSAKAVYDLGVEILALVNDDISNVESRLVLKESFSNKKNAIVGNETSEQYYPSIKAVVDYLAALEINAGSVGFDETETYAAGSIGAEVSAQKNAIKNLEAIPTEVKRAMDTLFSKAAYADDDAASSYATFHAWAIANPVTSITAVFTQGSATIYDTDSLDTLKQYLVVTATYADSTSVTVTDYTLSGTLTEGTSTITVSYGGKTTTFNVTVTEDDRYSVEYQGNFTTASPLNTCVTLITNDVTLSEGETVTFSVPSGYKIFALWSYATGGNSAIDRTAKSVNRIYVNCVTSSGYIVPKDTIVCRDKGGIIPFDKNDWATEVVYSIKGSETTATVSGIGFLVKKCVNEEAVELSIAEAKSVVSIAYVYANTNLRR